jgi:hypothetical protein
MTPIIIPTRILGIPADPWAQWLHEHLDRIATVAPTCPVIELLPLLKEAFEGGAAYEREAQR